MDTQPEQATRSVTQPTVIAVPDKVGRALIIAANTAHVTELNRAAELRRQAEQIEADSNALFAARVNVILEPEGEPPIADGESFKAVVEGEVGSDHYLPYARLNNARTLRNF